MPASSEVSSTGPNSRSCTGAPSPTGSASLLRSIGVSPNQGRRYGVVRPREGVHMPRRRGVAALVAAGLAGIALIAAGCTAGRPAASTRAPAAAAGQGAALNTSQVYPPDQRAAPGPVTGDLLDSGRYDLAAA